MCIKLHFTAIQKCSDSLCETTTFHYVYVHNKNTFYSTDFMQTNGSKRAMQYRTELAYGTTWCVVTFHSEDSN